MNRLPIRSEFRGLQPAFVDQGTELCRPAQGVRLVTVGRLKEVHQSAIEDKRNLLARRNRLVSFATRTRAILKPQVLEIRHP